MSASEILYSAGKGEPNSGELRVGRGAWPRRCLASASVANEIALGVSDGTLLVACGFIGAALRGGGHRRPIVAIEHGSLLAEPSTAWPRRGLLRLGRVGGTWANDVEVGVSDFMIAELRRYPHARRVQRTYNGIDPARYICDPSPPPRDGDVVVAFAGRLIAGKGADRLIEAVARIHPTQPIKLLVAGEGPERSRLEALARSTGVKHAVTSLDNWLICPRSGKPPTLR